MTSDEHYFVEWKEQFVSKERGNRVVHYFLKDNLGESILAVVGTERSVRHMFYVVSEEFLSFQGVENSVQAAGYRWRSRREVVNWLTSMLSKQHMRVDYATLCKDDPSFEVNGQMPSPKGNLAKNGKYHHLGISWSGAPWACGKQLKHYSSFSRNGISIEVQSFVFIMAEKDSRYLAYLEDMYEDRKFQKKVKVRWFHHNREVKGIASLQDLHPKEVFITPYAQVISAECVDGPAIVLTREHYEKCLAVFPQDMLGRVHFCFRQFKNNRVKAFKLSKLRGYFDQSIFACFSPDFFEEEISSEDDVKVGSKRKISCRENQKMGYDLSCRKMKYGMLSNHTPSFSVNQNVEFLCQDSGLRGCWFKCKVLEVSKRQMKILYNDVKDEDSCTNLEEWIPTSRIAKTDKLGMRQHGRPTVRPAYPSIETGLSFEVGDPADAWWSDGWWEGVITNDNKNGTYQIHIPGENLYMDIELKNLRVSKDWMGNQWVDIESNTSILTTIASANIDTKVSTTSDFLEQSNSDDSPVSCDNIVNKHKLSAVEEEIHNLAETKLETIPLKDDSYSVNKEQHQIQVDEESVKCSEHENVDEEKKADNDITATKVVDNNTLPEEVTVKIVDDTTLVEKVTDIDNDEKANEMDICNEVNKLMEVEITELKTEAMEIPAECEDK